MTVHAAAEVAGRRVADAMSRRVAAVAVDASMGEARRVADASGAHHVVVLDDGELVGVLCTCDVASAAAGAAVSDHMSVPVLTVRPETPLADAAETMRECDVGCLPVLAGTRLVGILSDRELAGVAVPGGRPHCECRCHRRRAPS